MRCTAAETFDIMSSLGVGETNVPDMVAGQRDKLRGTSIDQPPTDAAALLNDWSGANNSEGPMVVCIGERGVGALSWGRIVVRLRRVRHQEAASQEKVWLDTHGCSLTWSACCVCVQHQTDDDEVNQLVLQGMLASHGYCYTRVRRSYEQSLPGSACLQPTTAQESSRLHGLPARASVLAVHSRPERRRSLAVLRLSARPQTNRLRRPGRVWP